MSGRFGWGSIIVVVVIIIIDFFLAKILLIIFSLKIFGFVVPFLNRYIYMCVSGRRGWLLTM